jgi:hypothetical protein
VSETAERRQQLVDVCTGLPEVTVEGDQHLRFMVRGKTFAYYLEDHHGDGRIAVCCKAPPGDQDALIELDPERFYRPAYLPSSVRLDLAAARPDIGVLEPGHRTRGGQLSTRCAEAVGGHGYRAESSLGTLFTMLLFREALRGSATRSVPRWPDQAQQNPRSPLLPPTPPARRRR